MPTDMSHVFAVVPAFNEAAVIREVIEGLRSVCPNVVVVDDGSSDDTAEEASRAGAVVVHHVINRGQGAALQTGIEYCVRNGAEFVVTFDADGQHRSEDVLRMIAALHQSDADVAIGSRFLGLRSEIPVMRRILLRLAVWFMRLSSGMALSDAHNGLRVMRRRVAEHVQISIDGMAHASEIIDTIRRHRYRVVEVPIVVRYSEYAKRKGQSNMAAFSIGFEYLLRKWLR